MTLYGGFGKADITPPPDSGGDMDLRILGFWYDRARRYGPVRDPLYARAVALKAGGETVCVIALDLIGDAVGMSERIREHARKTLGLDPERVMVACTNTYTSPETIGLTDHPIHPRWMEYACHHAVDAAQQAIENAVPCRLFLGEGKLPGVSYNRAALDDVKGMERLGEEERARYAMLDDTLRVAALRGEDGTTLGVFFNFACQPVCVQTQAFISADWPGAALRRLEESFPAMFLNGACGDADPVRKGNYEDLKWVGEQVAKKVSAILADSGTMKAADDVTIAVAREKLTLRRRRVPHLEFLTREAMELEAGLAMTGPHGLDASGSRARERLFAIHEQLALGRMPETLEGEVHAVRIGPLVLAGVPGEMVACLGDDIRRAVKGTDCWVVGFANGYLGFCVPRPWYDVGGYEASPGRWSRLASGSGEEIRDAVIALAKKVSNS